MKRISAHGEKKLKLRRASTSQPTVEPDHASTKQEVDGVVASGSLTADGVSDASD
jgi:hypothetical protein